MMAQLGMPLVPELALFALAVLVLVVGLDPAGADQRIGWLTLVGLVGVFAPDVRRAARAAAVRRLVRSGRAGALRQAAVPRRRRRSACSDR